MAAHPRIDPGKLAVMVSFGGRTLLITNRARLGPELFRTPA